MILLIIIVWIVMILFIVRFNYVSHRKEKQYEKELEENNKKELSK